MGESQNQESDFVRVVTALFKEDIEDAVKSVYNTRIKPTIKRTAVDSLKDIIDRLFGVTPTQPSTIPAGSAKIGQQTTNYGKISTEAIKSSISGTTLALPADTGKAAVSNTNYNGLPNYVTVATYNDAQNVVNILNDKIREEGEASVNDLFDCAGKSNIISGNSVAARYGWYNIDGHSITQMENGQWMLSMPPYNYLKKEN